MMKYRSNMINL